MSRLLVIDDEVTFRTAIVFQLEDLGHTVTVASAAQEGITCFAQAMEEQEPFDIVLTDMLMPQAKGFPADGEAGLRVVEGIQQLSKDALILVMTAHGSIENAVKAVRLGAHDYLTKPFNAGVLAARVAAVLRRTQPIAPDAVEGRYVCGDLTIDFDSHRILRGPEEFHITPTEYRLLNLLVRNAGKVNASEAILTEVWGAEYANETQILRTHMNRLRKKVEPDPETPTYIRTRPGSGYRLDCPPSA